MQWPCVGEDLVALTIGGSDDKLIAVLCESLDASPLFRSGRDTIHFPADLENIELIMRTIHSANQLSIYGTVSS